MPFGDGTGPLGLGPMTGRGAGFCAGFGRPGFTNPWVGGGRFRRGLGFGYGYGWRRPYRYFYPSGGRYWVPAPFYNVPPYAPPYYPYGW
ncbi:MAG TPA: hypothetical protein DCE07_04505 [Peptococcaceae bacterium]|nr:hypothetical protein [Peptococcaceae bacterium]